jgi:hypothetical protein
MQVEIKNGEWSMVNGESRKITQLIYDVSEIVNDE